ncbi:MAG: glycoside hydrolase family 2 TIM barrel-domain containing protein, partial [Clostridia bacterium]
ETGPGDRILLNFEAVDWKCEIFINGMKGGSHEGGYLPFSIDITDLVKPDGNVLVVSVTDPSDSHWQQRGKQRLHPSSIWYTPTSGIWQTVWMETVPSDYIEGLRITPLPEEERVLIEVSSASGLNVRARINDGELPVACGSFKSNEPFFILLPSPRLWSPAEPFLYGLEIELMSGPDTIDSVTSYFGMRSVSIARGSSGRKMLLLNGSPVFLNGPLDQGYWPESGLTPPCDEAMKFDIRSMKELGFNAIRKHIKIEPRRWYYHADRLGILVIQDMVSGGRDMNTKRRVKMSRLPGHLVKDNNARTYSLAWRSDPSSRKSYEDELEGMLSHLHNSPAIIIWCPFNEAWGQYDSKRIYGKVRALDSSRAVDHVSGWIDQGCGDFLSKHTYIKKLKRPPGCDKRAYLISEYGGYNCILADNLWRDDDSSGYKYFPTTGMLMDAYEELLTGQVLPLIEYGLCGTIYTQLSDVEIETNGIYTYDRRVLKFDAKRMRRLHAMLDDAFRRKNE